MSIAWGNVLQQPEAQSALSFVLPRHLENLLSGMRCTQISPSSQTCRSTGLLKARAAWCLAENVACKGAPWTFLDTPRPPEFILSADSAPKCRGCHLLESEWLLIPQEQTRHEGWPGVVYGVWSGDQVCVSSLLCLPQGRRPQPLGGRSALHHHPRRVT